MYQGSFHNPLGWSQISTSNGLSPWQWCNRHIHSCWIVREPRLRTHPLSCAIPAYNINGTANEAGSIKEEVNIICTFGNHTKHATFLVTSLGRLAIILRHAWLVEHNPEVNVEMYQSIPYVALKYPYSILSLPFLVWVRMSLTCIVGAYMYKVNPNIFWYFLTFHLCITFASLFTYHFYFFRISSYFSHHSIHLKSLSVWHASI